MDKSISCVLHQHCATQKLFIDLVHHFYLNLSIYNFLVEAFDAENSFENSSQENATEQSLSGWFTMYSIS